MLLELANRDENPALAVNIIVDQIVENSKMLIFDLPAWVAALRILASSIESQMNEYQSKTYDVIANRLNVTTIAIPPYRRDS